MLQEDFDYYLTRFVNAMRAKFSARHDKQHRNGNKSVLDPGFRFSEDLDLRNVEQHFLDEMRERTFASTWPERCDEDVDVANMAFLDWAVRAARSDAESGKRPIL